MERLINSKHYFHMIMNSNSKLNSTKESSKLKSLGGAKRKWVNFKEFNTLMLQIIKTFLLMRSLKSLLVTWNSTKLLVQFNQMKSQENSNSKRILLSPLSASVWENLLLTYRERKMKPKTNIEWEFHLLFNQLMMQHSQIFNMELMAMKMMIK